MTITFLTTTNSKLYQHTAKYKHNNNLELSKILHSKHHFHHQLLIQKASQHSLQLYIYACKVYLLEMRGTSFGGLATEICKAERINKKKNKK